MAQSSDDKVSDLEREFQENQGKIKVILRQFRSALENFASDWIRESAKKTAISEDHITLSLGEEKLTELKEKIEAYVDSLGDTIYHEFSRHKYFDAEDASSGMVQLVLEKEFEEGIRYILGGLGPIMSAYNYRSCEGWATEGSDKSASKARSRHRYPYSLDPPIVLDKLMGDVIHLVTENKVISAKIGYFKKQAEKDRARNLWDSV
jgi:hypothetical protein